MCTTPSPNLIQTIIAGLPSIVMGIIGGLIGFFSARRISNLNAKHIAITNFRKAFAPVLAKIYLNKWHGIVPSETIVDFENFLKEALLGHAAAIEEYRFFVSKSQVTAYQEAWEKYRHEVWHFGTYHDFIREGEGVYELFERLIHNILQFA